MQEVTGTQTESDFGTVEGRVTFHAERVNQELSQTVRHL